MKRTGSRRRESPNLKKDNEWAESLAEERARAEESRKNEEDAKWLVEKERARAEEWRKKGGNVWRRRRRFMS